MLASRSVASPCVFIQRPLAAAGGPPCIHQPVRPAGARHTKAFRVGSPERAEQPQTWLERTCGCAPSSVYSWRQWHSTAAVEAANGVLKQGAMQLTVCLPRPSPHQLMPIGNRRRGQCTPPCAARLQPVSVLQLGLQLDHFPAGLRHSVRPLAAVDAHGGCAVGLQRSRGRKGRSVRAAQQKRQPRAAAAAACTAATAAVGGAVGDTPQCCEGAAAGPQGQQLHGAVRAGPAASRGGRVPQAHLQAFPETRRSRFVETGSLGGFTLLPGRGLGLGEACGASLGLQWAPCQPSTPWGAEIARLGPCQPRDGERAPLLSRTICKVGALLRVRWAPPLKNS